MSEEGVPVKLIIEEPNGETQSMEFEQGTIKIGRGRPGKKRKGVDVQLTDESVARVASVLHVRGLNDVYIMDMGSGVTRIEDKKVGARGKVTSGTEILIGNTKVTVYIGDDAAQDYSGEFDNALLDDAEGSDAVVVQANVSFEELDGVVSFDDGLPDEDLPTDMAAGAISTHTFHADGDAADTGEHGSFGAPTPAPATGSAQPTSAAPPDVSFSAPQGGFDANGSIPSQGSFGLPPDSQDNPGVPEGFGIYPVHQTPAGYAGPVGPTPPPLPETLAPNLTMLLDVADRLGKELWYTQFPLW